MSNIGVADADDRMIFAAVHEAGDCTSRQFAATHHFAICIAKIGRTCRLVPSGTGPWSPVGDHFGDQNVRWMFSQGVAPRNESSCISVPRLGDAIRHLAFEMIPS